MTQNPSPSSSAAILEDVLTFIKGANLQPGCKPGFAHALKLSYNTIAKERLSIDNSSPNTLTYRYKFSKDVPKATLGLLTALQDELSTNARFRVGRPSAPGASLQIQTELIETNLSSYSSDIDIVNIVTKLGRTISHTRTEFYCAESQRPLAYGSHVKYMPAGSWFLDLIFNKAWAYKLYALLVVQRSTLPVYEEKNLIKDVIRPHLEFQGVSGRATFHVTREHTNAFGALHGGCHAMVMEKVATVYAQEELKADAVVLEAMQVDYLAAGKGSIDVECETLGRNHNTSSKNLHVRVLLKREDGRILSDGKLPCSILSSKL